MNNIAARAVIVHVLAAAAWTVASAARAQPTETLPKDQLATVCWPELATSATLNEVDPIPVGCELVDCCPGCPKPDSLEWFIRLTGGPVESAMLAFDNLSPEQVARLKLDGDIKQGNAGNFRIGKGKARIMGLPGDAPNRPPVGRISLRYDQQWGAQRLAESSRKERSLDADNDDHIGLTVEQRLGKVIVNEYLLKYKLKFCGPHESDSVQLSNNTGDDLAVVLYGGLPEGGPCLHQESGRGRSRIPLGNLVPSASCRSDVSVFSDDNAMELRERVLAWTTGSLDKLHVELIPDRLMAPLVLWLVGGGSSFAQVRLRASTAVDTANFVYNINNTGIGFLAPPGRGSDMFGNTAASAVTQRVVDGSCDAASLAALTASNFFKPGVVNVYYTEFSSTGFACGKNRNVVFVGTVPSPFTLAHELGHALSLPDVESTDNLDFDNRNVMFAEGQTRKVLSEGQAFRANAHCASMLNLNGIRHGSNRPLRDCSGALDRHMCRFRDATCPDIDLDVLPN